MSGKCDFTLVSHDLKQCEEIINTLPDFDTWAYIHHDPDEDLGHEHYHFYIHLKQPTTIKALSEKLNIPPNFIEWVRRKTWLIQYFVHKNSDNKIKYADSDIVTNNFQYIDKFLNPKDIQTDIFKEFEDLSSVAIGLITPAEYIRLHSDSLCDLPFYSRQIFLMRLLNLREEGSPKIRY